MTKPDAAKPVAECWTCHNPWCGGKPLHAVHGGCRPVVFWSTQAADYLDTCRASGHDVRPVDVRPVEVKL
jgi:hypothetical protein